jgi:hypothetical protein
MKNILKYNLFFAVITLMSCSVDEPELFDYPIALVNQRFDSFTHGGGSDEAVPFMRGWINYNRLGSRQWHVRRNLMSPDNYVYYIEFSSFNSNASADPNDEVWLITPQLDFSKTQNEVIELVARSRFYNGNVLEVLISEDFNGLIEGITTATWTPIAINLPTDNAGATTPFTTTTRVSIPSNKKQYVAFKYTGSKASNPTSTIQLSEIKIFENRD